MDDQKFQENVLQLLSLIASRLGQMNAAQIVIGQTLLKLVTLQGKKLDKESEEAISELFWKELEFVSDSLSAIEAKFAEMKEKKS